MKPGDKVICVDDTFPSGVGPQGIRAGAEYTVRSVGSYVHPLDGAYRGVRLEEVVRGEDPAGYCEPDLPFRASRFRPVVSGVSKRELEEVV